MSDRVNLDFRHIQSFIVVFGRSDPTGHKSVECKVCTLEHFAQGKAKRIFPYEFLKAQILLIFKIGIEK